MTTTALISVQRSAQRADERVMRTVEGEIPPFDEVLSPELALVDSRLAAGARERLPEVEVLALRPLPEPEALDEVLAATARRLARLRLAPPVAPQAPSRVEPPPHVTLPLADDSTAAALPGEERGAAPMADDDSAAEPPTLSADSPRVPLPRLAESPPRAAMPTSAMPRVEPASAPVERAWGAPVTAPPAHADAEHAARRLADVSIAAEVERGPRRRQVLVGVVASSAAIAIALLVADRALDRDTVAPTAQASVTLEQPDSTSELPGGPTPEPSPTTDPGDDQPPTSPQAETPPPTTSRSPRPQAVPGPRTFAWAPVPNATAYHVELFRKGKRIFAVNTTRPRATVPASWTFEGRKYRLEPAEYRWFVWPVVSGRRLARAVVQARLVVTPS
jgi:hypothetical protein